ncbi:MAG: alpha/beta fold hydrolase [Tuberibacillus sp.]
MGENIVVNGVSIYYEHHGQPLNSKFPVIIMIHGYLSSCFSFRYLIPLLKDHYTIYTLDLPGFGRSEKSKTFIYSLNNYGKLIVAFMDALKLEKPVLIGHSMGGQIALQAARIAPTKISKVVGLAAAGYMGRVKRPIVLASYLPFFHYILRFYFNKKDVIANFLEVTYNKNIINEEMMEGYLTPLKEKAFYRSFVHFIRHREGDMPSELVHEIKQPVLLLWGREDQIVPVSIGERFKNDLPNARLKVYNETGHLLPEERPDEVAQDIERFIQLRD